MKILTIIIIIKLTICSNIYSQDFWEKISGLDGIIIYSLGINSSGDIFAGADTSYGVFRSTDNGGNWTSGLDTLQITGIVIRPNGEILVTTLDYLLGGGVFHSTNNGDSWNNMGYTGAATSLAMNSIGDIFVGTFGNGIVRSTNNGANWVQISQGGLINSQVTAVSISSGNGIFVGTYIGGIFRSTDNGNNWEEKGFTDTVIDTIITSLAINSSGYIFAGTEGSGVFRSTDNGENWVPISQGLAGQALFIFSLAINSSGDIFIGTSGGVFRSINNGGNWVQINQGLTNDDVHSLAINSNGDIFAGTEAGIFRTIPSANMKIFLQGPYVSATGTMSTTLNTNGYIPLTQPYNTAPWNYTGTESVDTIPAGVVDWILLELRSDLTTQVSRRAAFLLSDGSVVDLDGVSSVKFPGVVSGDFYVVIRHRNHLAIMSSNPVTLSYSPVLYDFSTAQTQAYGSDAEKDLGGGVFGLYTGDGNRDGLVTSTDFNVFNPKFTSAASGYEYSDWNLDGLVTRTDFNFFNPNFTTAKQTFVP